MWWIVQNWIEISSESTTPCFKHIELLKDEEDCPQPGLFSEIDALQADINQAL